MVKVHIDNLRCNLENKWPRNPVYQVVLPPCFVSADYPKNVGKKFNLNCMEISQDCSNYNKQPVPLDWGLSFLTHCDNDDENLCSGNFSKDPYVFTSELTMWWSLGSLDFGITKQ